jgi:hypothetical protein
VLLGVLGWAAPWEASLAVETAKEFEDVLSQLCRLYRAQRELFETAEAADPKSITRWVRTGGKIMEKMDEVLSDIEVYSGLADLRITVAELKQMRDAKESAAEKA